MSGKAALKAPLPPVWSPWSDATTMYFTGSDVSSWIVSTMVCDCSTSPWPSATRTPSLVITMRLTVLIT